MALNCAPATGPISLEQVRTLLGDSGEISLDDDNVRIFANRIGKNPVTFDNLRGKCPIYTVNVGQQVRAWEGDNPFNLDSYVYNINLRTLANNSGLMPQSGPPPGSRWVFNLLCNVGSKQRNGYAIDTGTWPHPDIELVLQNPPLTDQFGTTITIDTDDSLKIARWVAERTKGPCDTTVANLGGLPCIPGFPQGPNMRYRVVAVKPNNPYRNFPVEGSRFCVNRNNRNEPCNGGANCVPDWVTYPNYPNPADFRNCRMSGERFDTLNPRAFRGFFIVERAQRVPANPKTFGRFEKMNFYPVQGLIAGMGGEGINVNNANALAGGQTYRGNGTVAADYGSNRSGGSAIVLNHPLTLQNSGIIGAGGSGGLGHASTETRNQGPGQNIGGGAGLPPGGYGWSTSGTPTKDHARRATFLTGGFAGGNRAGDLGQHTGYRLTRPAIVTNGHALSESRGFIRGDILPNQRPTTSNLSTRAGWKIGLEGVL